ncbi:hypothetical protein K445DRAFT_45638, partial [Daldinia sp. EC12]
KRRREIRSCDTCRQRKLRCDRVRPSCGRCSRNGKLGECIWPQDAEISSTADDILTDTSRGQLNLQHQKPKEVAKDMSKDSTSTLEALTEKVATLEAALRHETSLRSANVTIASSVYSNLSDKHTKNPFKSQNLPHFFRGESFQTKYNGSTHPSLLVISIPGFASFMREASQEFQVIEDIRQKVHKVESQATGTWPINWLTKSELQALLPPKPTTDRLVQAYLDSFDHIYHILYLPTFQSQYEQLWAKDLSVSADEKFLLIVLLVIAVAMCLTSTAAEAENCEDSPPSRNQATRIIRFCENWLQQQRPRHSDLPDFQISFLLLFARQLNARRFKQTWANAGKIVRNFMCAGLHMEPSQIHVDCLLHREIRRRLWASVAEFELQASFEHGMPATAWPLQGNISSLKNAADEDLKLQAVSRPVLEFTQSSYLATAYHSIRFRHSLNALLNDLYVVITFDDAKDLTKRINEHIAHIPLWADREAAVPKSLLSINLYQYQLALHFRQIQQARTLTERDFSRKVLLDTAKEVVGLHMAIPEEARGALELLSSDHVRAALSLCFSWVISGAQIENVMLEHNEEILQLLQQVTALLTIKFARYGGDQRQLWIVTAATAFIKTRTIPED